MPPWSVTLFTVFPDMFPGPLGSSIAGKALDKALWEYDVVNIREHASDTHQTVDDKPFGGGTGMVFRPDILGAALEVHKPQNGTKYVYLSPRGAVFNQQTARKLIETPHLSIICGRYEGIDQRIIDFYDMEEVSIGDFILSGGEIAAYVLLDTCIRLLPSVLKSTEAITEESFGTASYADLLEYPHYTRPALWNDLAVPDVLLSGHHKEISEWRLEQAKKITKERRKDLWNRYISSHKQEE